MSQWIGLLDCNNFFVSCERLFRPDLCNRPVAVLSSNDGCIVARSQEVKDRGIPMGVPYFKVKDTLIKSKTVLFSSHFALYRDISRRVFETMADELDTIEQYSIDEAFFVLPESDNPLQVAKSLKDKIERAVGIPVSIGISRSKTLAKVASAIAKKTGGIKVMDLSEWQEKKSHVPLHSIWGIGRKSADKYRKYNLETAADLTALQHTQIKQLFGAAGVRIWSELQGAEGYSIERKRSPQGSILSSRSFRSQSSDLHDLQDAVAYHIRHAAADLRSMNMKASYLKVYLAPSRYGDFMLRNGAAEMVLTSPTNDTFALVQAANKLTEHIFEIGIPYKKAGVLLSQFSPESFEQLPLFGNVSGNATAALTKLLDVINKKTDRELLMVGSHLKTKNWQSKHESRSPAYTTNWADIATVRS